VAEDPSLEEILRRFESDRTLFRLPETLSFENPDITVKYMISMLNIAPEERREEIVTSFCSRFKADREQMHRLLADQNRYADYLLYTAFSCHTQQQLELDTDTFFKEVSDRTFLDHGDGQIRIARTAVPLSFVLKNMAKQFPNWSRVNALSTRTAYATYSFDEEGKFRVRKNSKLREVKLSELNDVIITRSTLPVYRERLRRELGEELELFVLKRDCDQTVHSFHSTFHGLYQQPDLEVHRTKCEGEGDGYSEYLIHPSAPYQSLLQRGLDALGRGILMVIPGGALYWRRRYSILEEEAHQRKRIIADQGSELKELLAQLQRKQLTFLDFMKRVAGNNAVGPSHQMRGVMTKIYNETRRLVLEEVSNEIADRYRTLDWSEERRAELTSLCSCFELDSEALLDRERIYQSLSRKLEVGEVPFLATDDDDPFRVDLGEGLAPTQDSKVYFRSAYTRFLERRTAYAEGDPFWAKFDPFKRIETLEVVAEGKDTLNQRLAEKKELFEMVRLSQALEEAVAVVRKKGSLEVLSSVNYNPEIRVDHDTIVYWLADLLTNSLEHGQATRARITSYNPSERSEEDLPFFKKFTFSDYPLLYLRVEDDGLGIPLEHAERLNRYFSGDPTLEGNLSSRKEGGGIGSRKARELMTVLDGRVYYESTPKRGTTIHIYLGKLEI